MILKKDNEGKSLIQLIFLMKINKQMYCAKVKSAAW